MKLGMEIAYGLVMAALAVFFIRSVYRKKEKNARIIRIIMFFAGMGELTSFAQLLSRSRLAAELSYAAFFISMIWLLAALLCFASHYCAYHLERFVPPWLVVGLCAADTVQLLVNPWFRHAYRVYQRVWGGDWYWVYESRTGFHVHLCISCILIAAIVLIMIDKRRQMPHMYRAKYGWILSLFCQLVLLDILHLLTNSVVNYAVPAFPLVAVAIDYYAMEYVPRALVNRTLGMAVDEMPDGVLIMDVDRRVVYKNARMDAMFAAEMADAEHFDEWFDRWCKKNYQSPDKNFVYDWAYDTNEKKRYLKLQYRRLLDEDEKYVGCYLNVQERTEEIETLLEERYAATHDYLTGLYNREYFYKQAERCLHNHPKERYLMICSDVRSFKMINDVFGRQAADQLLVNIADALRAQTISGEVYGRLVNDRFALLMKKRDYREMKFTEQTAEVMKITNEISYPLKVYLGVYEVDDISLPVAVMCDRALLALDTIKGDYQKQVAYYDAGLRHRLLQEQELSAQLDRAISEGQIELYVQPQITADNRCMGGEALVRWNHPQRGLLMPGSFVPAFERNGLIVKLDRHVWELACRQLHKWKAAGHTDRYLSVNISPKDFFFVDVYQEFLMLTRRYEIDPANLKLEITESAMMHDLPKQLVLIGKLREAGFIVEMDDFGSGYSSLNMLKDIRVDVLKIDMEFLRQSENEDRSRTILKMIIALAKELGMPVITEGVETKEHVDFLTKVGCDMFQGYFFARPMRISDYEEKYMN